MSDNKDESATEAVTPYKESDEHVPAKTDMYGVFQTSGTGAHHDPATASPIYDTDRQFIAEEVLKALDPEDPTPSDRVLFAEPKAAVVSDTEGERNALKDLAQARLDEEVVVGGPSKAEAEAGESETKPAKTAAAKPKA